MSIHKIRSALVQAFESGGFSLPAVYENTSHDSDADIPWCSFFFIPNQPSAATLGDQGEDDHTGIVQINLNYPLLNGSGEALQKADEIRAVFKAGATFSYLGQNVFIKSSGVSRASQVENGFYQTILTIQWQARTSR